MKIKKFIAANMQEGKELILKELGNEAVILSNRPTTTKNGINAIEIVAGLENENITPQPKTNTKEQYNFINPNQLLTSLDSTLNQKLIAEVNTLKDMIATLSDNVKYKYTGTMNENLARVYKIMKDSDFEEEVCLNIIGKIAAKGIYNDFNSAMEEAKKQILNGITFFEPILQNTNKKQIITFIGSSGSGKTTTLIKLAIAAKLLNQAKVLIISTDTCRVGATEQLQLLTGIAGINFMLAYNPEEVNKIINEEQKYNLILIDTDGKNPNSKTDINELEELQNTITEYCHAELVSASPNTNEEIPQQVRNDRNAVRNDRQTKSYTFLILSAVNSLSSLNNNIKKFSELTINSAVITRTDEAFGLGNIITALNKKNIPISYFTNGQSIPDDIEQADNERLNDYLFTIC